MAIDWRRTLPGPVLAVYEAGPTGLGLARAARTAGIEMMVCSPGAIPRQAGDRVKTDMRDAPKLARLHAAGQLRPVVVPEPQLEALRDLVRAREDLRGDLMGARQRISKLLLRRGLVFAGSGEMWSRAHLAWLGSVRFDEPLADSVFPWPHDLTRRELQILHLIGAGLSNPQIAERLFVSWRTVAKHVEHILSKLGCASRAQLADKAVAEGPILGEEPRADAFLRSLGRSSHS